MLWIPILIFVAIMVGLLAAYLMIVPDWTEKREIKKRLSLLELRNLRLTDLPDILKSELLSDVPVINKILVKLNIAVRMDKLLKQANMDMKVGTFILLSCVLFGFGLLVGTLLHWPFVLGLFLGVILFFLPTIVVKVKKDNRIKKFILYFPEALEMFARSLRAGHSFTGAIQLVAQEMPDPIGTEFRKVFDEQNLGIPPRIALLGLTERVDILDVKFFVTAVLIQRDTGGNLAEIIDKIAYVIRERFRIQGQLKIHTAQARMTGIVLAFLPIAVAFGLFAMSPGYMRPLLTDPMGRSMVFVAVVMQILGMLVIRKIIRIKI